MAVLEIDPKVVALEIDPKVVVSNLEAKAEALEIEAEVAVLEIDPKVVVLEREVGVISNLEMKTGASFEQIKSNQLALKLKIKLEEEILMQIVEAHLLVGEDLASAVDLAVLVEEGLAVPVEEDLAALGEDLASAVDLAVLVEEGLAVPVEEDLAALGEDLALERDLAALEKKESLPERDQQKTRAAFPRLLEKKEDLILAGNSEEADQVGLGIKNQEQVVLEKAEEDLELGVEEVGLQVKDFLEDLEIEDPEKRRYLSKFMKEKRLFENPHNTQNAITINNNFLNKSTIIKQILQ